MSTVKSVALYQIETFGAGARHSPSRDERHTGDGQHAAARNGAAKESGMNRQRPPTRASEFLVQLMVGGDADLRKLLGRRDVAEQREAAYCTALSNRPSARPLSFLQVIGNI